jgi:membrane-bound lytic murein transglycosylase F
MIKKTAILVASALVFATAATASGKQKRLQTRDRAGYYTGHFLLWPVPRTRISEWDSVIRHASDYQGYDWRFVSAVACVESGFRSGVVSRAGAVGLMQVMPSVARQFDVPFDRMTDPFTNVMLGIDLLKSISRTFRFPDSTSDRDRWSIILASYNAGAGHVLDARRLAIKYGENHNSWEVVSKYMILKTLPDYYMDEVVRSGDFYGSGQTLEFVRKVLSAYDCYTRKAKP